MASATTIAVRPPRAGTVIGHETDAWPRTTRLTPWFLAGFIAILWLVPFDAIDLPFALPFDSKLDRIALVAILLVAGVQVTLYPRRTGLPPTPFVVVLTIFIALATTSLALNLETTTRLGDSTRGLKELLLLICYALFFVAVTRTVRPAEVRNFVRFTLALAVLLALGTLWEYRTGYNVFYDFARQTFGLWADVGTPPPDPKFGRPTIVGPGVHPLVPVTMLAMALPFAIIGLMNAGRNRRLVHLLVAAILLAGTVATVRKASFIAPTAGLLVLLAYRPRAMVRLIPLGIVMLAMVQVAAPGAAVTVKSQFVNITAKNTTRGRTNDYAAIAPDVVRHPVLGRGYGTYDPLRYRILDNQYLGLVISMGFLGAGALILLLFSTIWTAHRVIRSRNPSRAGPALGAAAAALAFGASGALFDILSFPQVPYTFFLFAGLMCVVVRAHRLEVRGAPPD